MRKAHIFYLLAEGDTPIQVEQMGNCLTYPGQQIRWQQHNTEAGAHKDLPRQWEECTQTL